MLVQLSFQINSSDDSHLDSEISRGFICSPNALGGPVLESRHMREQEVPPHPKHTTHRAVKRTHTIKRGRKGRKKKRRRGKKKPKKTQTSRVISCSSRSAFIYKALGTPYFCSHLPALLMSSSHHLFPLWVDISKDFGFLTCSWKTERQESLHILKKTRLLAKPEGNVNRQQKRRRGSHETLSSL